MAPVLYRPCCIV